jgi:hypothetical protein
VLGALLNLLDLFVALGLGAEVAMLFGWGRVLLRRFFFLLGHG